MDRPRIMVLAVLVVAALVVLPTQATADITGVTVSPNPPIAGTPVIVTVSGTGFCPLVLVNFGDEAPIGAPVALPMAFQHIYRLPPGPKTITVTALGGLCKNVRSITVNVQAGRLVGIAMFPSRANSGDMTTATINGKGECGRIRVTFGDGWADELSSIKTWPQFVEHRYNLASASLGEVQENVKAEGIQDCSGVISTRVYVNASLPVTRPINMIQGIRPIFPAGSADIQLDQPVSFVVTGLGSCTKLRIDWGDGTPPEDAANVALYTNPRYSHLFTGWGGGKTVTAMGVDGCLGRVNTRFKVQPEVFVLAYNATGPMVCNAVAQPPLVVPTIVHITTTPVTFNRPDNFGRPHLLSGIDFGCPFYGCVYDANGKPDSVAAAPFPFPGLREYSLILRVGTQVVQGGTNVQFTTTQTGPLEICVNDNNVSDNIGGLILHIRVNQLGPPPPP